MVVSSSAFYVIPPSAATSSSMESEKVPWIIWGLGTPNGDEEMWVKANKGSLYLQVDAGDDESHIWMKVDEGGDNNDWERIWVREVSPVRTDASYSYGMNVDSDLFFTGGAATKSYLMQLAGDRTLGNAATGDSNDAYLKIAGSNYAANDANFILRGLNIGITNRSGGVMGRLENSMGVQNKSGGVVDVLFGATIISENYGTVDTDGMACDFINRDENDTSRGYAGVIRLRNDDRSSQSALDSAIDIDSHGSSGGYDTLIDATGATLTEYDSGTQVVLMTFKDAAGTTQYLIHDTNTATVLEVATSVS